MHIFIIVIIPRSPVRELEFPASATLCGVFALEGSNVGAYPRGRLRLINVHPVWVVVIVSVLPEDEFAIEIDLGFCPGRFAHFARFGGGDVGEGLLVEKIEGLVVIFNDVGLAALLGGLLLVESVVGSLLLVIIVVGGCRVIGVAAVERLIVLVVVLAFVAGGLAIVGAGVAGVFVTAEACAGGILSLLGAFFGFADVDDELLVGFGAVLVDEIVAKAADHALENVLDFGFEVALVFAAPDDEVGDQSGEAGHHELDGEADDAYFHEAEAALDDFAVVGCEEEIHGLHEFGEGLLPER